MAFFAIHSMFGLIDVKFVKQEFDSIGVRNLKSKLLIIFFGLYNIKLIILKFVCMFFGFIIT